MGIVWVWVTRDDWFLGIWGGEVLIWAGRHDAIYGKELGGGGDVEENGRRRRRRVVGGGWSRMGM